MRQRLLTTLFLSLVIVLAGCISLGDDTPSTTPIDSPTPTTAVGTPATDPVTVDPAEAVTFRVTAASDVRVTGSVIRPENDGVRIHYDGSSRTYPGVLSPEELPAGALDGATGVEPINPGDSVAFAVSGGTGGSAFEFADRPSSMLVTVVESGDTVVRWFVVDCVDLELTSVEVTVNEEGEVSHVYGCGAFGVE
ncbi:hypothetical protein [Halapricum hydrolyticum]|uniref:Uncharacterized protein n=1 Tax=Halapricum hydrolyticum TaxID=2979991 RepID=A0AAE3ID49_9EURY|nr:hypothetical protein [Halapricum hydrolyticum]MCU4719386.1 hypothetical protein [Halapricum hydrolyticum]MCU4728395.1 hypothetical protein [Halapricum hydrolyticum]